MPAREPEVAGSSYNADTKDYPGVPYTSLDFHADCSINYFDTFSTHNCWAVGLQDLKTESAWVRDRIADYMNDLVSIGVAGFRIDAAKHVNPDDIEAILGNVNDLDTAYPSPGRSALCLPRGHFNQ